MIIINEKLKYTYVLSILQFFLIIINLCNHSSLNPKKPLLIIGIRLSYKLLEIINKIITINILAKIFLIRKYSSLRIHII